MKIDIFTHILPKKYVAKLLEKNNSITGSMEFKNQAATNLEMRFRIMDRYPDVLQVLTISHPPIDLFFPPKEAIELARIANDELANLVMSYPDKFAAAVACLPLNDIDAAIDETDRAIKQLGLRGIQIYATIRNEKFSEPKYKFLFKKMSEFDLPVWIHPVSDEFLNDAVFGWPFITSLAMKQLVASGVFIDFPKMKFIIHHCGAMAPYFSGRIKWLFPLGFEIDNPIRNYWGHFQKFFADTATYGSTATLKCGYDFFGINHMLFGTDAPMGARFGVTQETIEAINRMELTEDENNLIFFNNATNLLKLAI